MTPTPPRKKAGGSTRAADDVAVFLDALDHPLKQEILALRATEAATRCHGSRFGRRPGSATRLAKR